MSALDQAITKAYAKERSTQPAAAPFSLHASAPPRAARRNQTHAIEQIYRDGSLYRVEAIPTQQRTAGIIPTPHVASLPPTSPRRAGRRTMMRRLANSAAAAE